MKQHSYVKIQGKSILVNCPECVSREIAKRKKQLEAEFNAEEQEPGFEFRAPPYREMEDEIDFEGLGLIRSEEHTSELQSLVNLVCRLLLEKKKTN